MKIAIDGSGAMGTQSGVGIYIYRLVSKLYEIDKNNDYLVYLNSFRPGKKNPFTDCPFKTNRIPAKIQRILQNQLNLPIETFTKDIDIFHGPNYFVPPTRNAKTVVSVHDLTFIDFSETMYKNDATYYQKYVPESIKRADHVITISNSTKKGLIEKLNVPEEKITITYLAAGNEFKPLEKDKVTSITEKYNLTDQFMFAVGTLEPRKNLITLIKALSCLKKDNKLTQKLVIAGGSGWKNSELFTAIKEFNLDKNILFIDYVPQKDLPALYNACSVFLFPSLYEGFGIPPLEALGCGCPTICSNTSSIPEVVGDAALLIEPTNEELWAENIEKVLNNPELAKELSKKGIEQAKRFSWRKTAEETLNVYQKLIGQ